MICTQCATAADGRAPRDQHCPATGGPGAAARVALGAIDDVGLITREQQ